MSDPDTEEVRVSIIRETADGILLRNQTTLDESWFPKSEIIWKSRNIKQGVGIADIPLWLLERNDW